MNSLINVGGKEYTLATDYKDNNELRKSFNDLTRKVFGFDFEDWYKGGYWGNNYLPYSILDAGNIVANVSVNIMDFMIMGQQKRYIQIGTVMTDEDYSRQGLSRALIEKILTDWQGKCEFIYLFANDSVLDFYPKFGFKLANEYYCSKKISKNGSSNEVRKLDADNEEDRNLIVSKASNFKPASKISSLNNTSLIMFYCTTFMKENVYYIEKYDAVVIAEYEGENLFLQDVFSAQTISIDNIIEAMLNENIRNVTLGFTPLDSSSFEIKQHKSYNTLFIRTENETPFETNQLLFPALSHA